MASVDNQFEQGRIPIKPLPYKQHNLSQCNELMIDYGEDGNYHIYITHHRDPEKYIDITALIVKEMLPEIEINANQFTLTIEGERDPQKLQDIINYIWKRFTYAEDPSGFVYEDDVDKIFDPSTINVLLQTTDGQIQLPVTLAENVFDKNGNSIQSTLDNMTRLGFSVSYIYVTENNQLSFDFDYPFEDYPDMMEVRIGTTYIDSTRYQITKHYDIENHFTSGTITFIGESIEIGRRIDLVWIFNVAYQEGGRVQFMSGTKIAESTIPTSKLEKVSDSYVYPNSNSVATSKAVANLYTNLVSAINANNQNLFNCADESKSSTIIKASIGRDAKASDIIVVALASNKSSTATLSINNKTFNIKTPDGNALVKGFRNSQVVKFKIDGTNAIVISGINADIRNNKYVYTCADQEYSISFADLQYYTGDIIHVYRNGVRLFQDLDYSINYTSETITLFVRTEQDERIIFESLGI